MVTHNVQLLSDLFCPQKGPQTLAQFGAGVGSLLAKTPSGCADQYAGSSQQDSPVGDQQSHAKSLGGTWESQITGRPRGKPCGTRAVPPKVVSHFSLSRKVVCPASQPEREDATQRELPYPVMLETTTSQPACQDRQGDFPQVLQLMQGRGIKAHQKN